MISPDADLAVEVVDVADLVGLHVLVALLHLLHQPGQRGGGLLRLGDDRRDQVRDALVRGELHHLGVDEDHPDLVGRGPREQRDQHRVDEARLAGAGGARDEQVRHLGQVGAQEVALDVLAEPDHHRVLLGAGGAAAQHVAEAHHLAVGVGHLDADGRLARDRGEDPHVVGGDRVGDVLGELRDLLDLDGRAELDLVARDRRAPGEAGDLRVDGELLQHAGDRLDHRVVGAAAALRHGSGGQQVAGRQLVDRAVRGGLHRETQLLAHRGVRLGLPYGWGGRGLGRLRGRGGRLLVRVDVGHRGGLAAARGATQRDRRGLGHRVGHRVGAALRGLFGVGGSAAEEPPQPVRHLAHGRRREEQQRVARQQHEHRRRDPRGEAGGQRGGRDVADRAATARPARGFVRPVGGEVDEPQHGEDEQEPADGHTRPRVRARVGRHEHHADDREQHGEHDRAAPHHVADARRHRAPDRTARAEPDPGRADDGEHQQCDAEAVTTVGGVDLPGAAERPARGPTQPGDGAPDRVDHPVDEVRALPGRRSAPRRRRAPCGWLAPRGGSPRLRAHLRRQFRHRPRPGAPAAAARGRPSCHCPTVSGIGDPLGHRRTPRPRPGPPARTAQRAPERSTRGRRRGACGAHAMPAGR